VVTIAISEAAFALMILTIMMLKTRNNPRRRTDNKQRIDWATVLMVCILLALTGLTAVLSLGEVLDVTSAH